MAKVNLRIYTVMLNYFDLLSLNNEENIFIEVRLKPEQ